MSKDKKTFIGQNEVKEISENKQVDLVGVLYTNGQSQDFTVEQWEAVKSEKDYPESEVFVRKFSGLIVRIIGELVDGRVTVEDHNKILETVSSSIGINYKAALAKLFGNVNRPEEVMLLQIDQILKDK